MSYTNDMQWKDWAYAVGNLSNVSTSLAAYIQQGKAFFDKYAALSYGLTDAQVAALPQFAGRTVQDIVNLRFAVSVFDAINTTYVAQKSYLTPFE